MAWDNPLGSEDTIRRIRMMNASSVLRCYVVDGIERDYANAKAVARAMAERDPEVRLH